MAGNASNYLEDALINGTLRNTAYTPAATVYLALYTTNPADDNSGTEVSGGSYARQSIAFDAPANGVTQNTAQVSFPIATAGWGSVGFWGILDAVAAGNLLYYGSFTTAQTVSTGNQVIVNIGQITVTCT